MSSVEIPITVDQRSHFVKTIARSTRVSPTTFARKDLTGFVYTGQIRSSWSDPVKQAEFTFTIQDQTVAETRGLVTWELTKVEASKIAVPAYVSGTKGKTFDYVYDIFENDVKIFRGKATIIPTVTNETI